MGLFGGGGGAAGGFMGIPSVGGSLWNREQNNRQFDREADFSRASAKDQQGFQKYMSDTAHQREVADLKKAGLNPVLSGTGGAGSSTPGGAMASTPTIGRNPLVMAGRMDFNAGPQRDLVKAQAAAAITSADVNKATAAKVEAETKILGPKSFLYDKARQMFESGANKFEDYKKSFDNYKQDKSSPNWGKP